MSSYPRYTNFNELKNWTQTNFVNVSGDIINGGLTANQGITANSIISESVSASVYYGLPPTTYQNSTPIPADFPNSDSPSVEAGSTIFSTPKSFSCPL